MTNTRRYYKCGCAPDEEHFCTKAADWKHREYIAAMDRVPLGDYEIPADDLERAAFREGRYRGMLIEHFRLQEDLGRYEDVDFDAPEMQEPDPDYDPADLV